MTPGYLREIFPFLPESHFWLRRVTLALNLQDFHVLIIVLWVISVRATSTDSNHFNGRLPQRKRSSGGGGGGDRLTFPPRCGGSAWEEVDGMKGSRCLIKASTLFAETWIIPDERGTEMKKSSRVLVSRCHTYIPTYIHTYLHTYLVVAALWIHLHGRARVIKQHEASFRSHYSFNHVYKPGRARQLHVCQWTEDMANY